MPRPRKCRKVCCLPKCIEFVPAGAGDQNAVIMSVDEYETIRLIDRQGFSQEECGAYMKIARATVQQIYNSARQKIARALVDGLTLKIEGGAYQLCDGKEAFCGCGGCQRHQSVARDNTKEDKTMNIAVTYENGQIFQHFGHTEQFKLYEVADGEIVKTMVVDTNGSGHGALAGFLADHRIDALICGGIGPGAQIALAEAGIKLFGGVCGDADEAVKALLAGNLAFNPDVRCSHHDHDHGEGHHACGEHGCGGHSFH